MHSEATGRIIGHVGKNPEVSATANGRRVRFSICHNQNWLDQSTGEWKTKAKWFWVTAFERTPRAGQQQRRRAPTLVERIEKHVRSGSYIMVDVDLEPRTYQVRGEDREALDLVVQRLAFLEPRDDDAGGGGQYYPGEFDDAD